MNRKFYVEPNELIEIRMSFIIYQYILINKPYIVIDYKLYKINKKSNTKLYNVNSFMSALEYIRDIELLEISIGAVIIDKECVIELENIKLDDIVNDYDGIAKC